MAWNKGGSDSLFFRRIFLRLRKNANERIVTGAGRTLAEGGDVFL
jgi:hypothetical protein